VCVLVFVFVCVYLSTYWTLAWCQGEKVVLKSFSRFLFFPVLFFKMFVERVEEKGTQDFVIEMLL
jgi:hypothetical protein